MSHVIIREPTKHDEKAFLDAMERSQSLHQPWVSAPLTSQEFEDYLARYQKANQKSFLVCELRGMIAGVFNISEIVRGLFQNAFLGFYAVNDFAGQGYMSAGLKLVLQAAFNELGLHRIEANIQPENNRSIYLVKKNRFRYEGYSPRYLHINNEWRGHEHWAITYEDFIRDNSEVIEKDSVMLVAYQAEWPDMAQKEIEKIKAAFPANKIIDIQHVGSTAIPGMMAKPIIDIQISVASLDEIKLIAIPLLEKFGYEYWAENPDPTRLFFVKGMPPYGERRTHHVHICQNNSVHWKNKILFRDYLRAHPEAAKEYTELKNRLAIEHAQDREKYTDAKQEFINHILMLAGS